MIGHIALFTGENFVVNAAGFDAIQAHASAPEPRAPWRAVGRPCLALYPCSQHSSTDFTEQDFLHTWSCKEQSKHEEALQEYKGWQENAT